MLGECTTLLSGRRPDAVGAYSVDVLDVIEDTDFLATNPWTCGEPLAKHMVSQAFAAGNFNAKPYSTKYGEQWHWTFEDHMARIAYIARNPENHTDPIIIEIDPSGMTWVNDGNHRLAAAWWSQQPMILAEFIG